MQAQAVTFSNETKVRVMVQIFSGPGSFTTAFVDANTSQTLSAESRPYDLYCKDVVSGHELSRLLDSNNTSVALQSKNSRYITVGDNK